MNTFVALLAGVTVAACAADPTPPRDDPEPPPTPISPTVEFLSPTQHLSRASIALRGVRPSLADLKAVDADPAQLPAIIDRYLGSPLFGETIKELHNETLLFRVEQPNMTMPDLGVLAGMTASQMNGSILEEPLRLIEDIVMSDQPYTKIVTSDYTMADRAVATVWGLPHAGAPNAWERTPWPDGRGNAGILSSTALYFRWRSNGDNYNRGRANVISRALLCHDFLGADIAVDTTIDLSDPDVVANAVVANSSCAGCHQTLDPLASYLFRFRGNIVTANIAAFPVPYYTPETADRWQRTNKRPPLFFGEAAEGLAGLGARIAADPRFARCAAMHFASYLSEVREDDVSLAWVARLQAAFVASGFNAKQLAKAVVLSDEFRVSHDTDAALADHLVGYQKLRPEQLSRVLTDLTGFKWMVDSPLRLRLPFGIADLLTGDFVGFRVLAGGIDSFFVTQPVHTMNATSSLVTQQAAAAAADFVVERDAAAAAADRKLFVAAAVTDTDEVNVRAQLVHLHGRIFGELLTPTSPEIDESYDLFREALASAGGGPRRAWKLTLTGLLADVRSLYY
ncbi:MAG: DUF1585 domain-containing protein [Deltaproteobacteria bacterium]|nr:DUF1585 domain-containing protein [Deltaproteobacteria bacterium]